MTISITLVILFVVNTSAHPLRSIISVARPFEDVQKNCDQDVLKHCRDLDKQTEWKEVDASRRLLEVQTPEGTISRSYSVSFGVSITPRNELEKTAKRVKDDTLFLNYGPETDNCLWNIYDKQEVSEKCASALKYVNDNARLVPCNYDDEDACYSVYTKVAISFSGFSALIIILSYLIMKQLFENDDQDDEDEDTMRDQSRSEHDQCQLVTGSTEIFTGVPMRIV